MQPPREVPELDDDRRYHRQMLLPGIGAEGQARLRESRAVLVGCGALGTVIADLLSRAGIGTLVVIDRDLVEPTNLQRQVLFDESDATAGMPKAEAARRAIARVNRQVRVEAHVAHFDGANAEQLAAGADLLLDGLDNFETRYLLNDLAVKLGLPYCYGGAVGTTGATMTILPHPARRAARAPGGRVAWSGEEATPCLRCVFPEPPPPGSTPTCDVSGVLASIVHVVAARQAAEAIKLLTGNVAAIDRGLRSIDLWANDDRRFVLDGARRDDACPCCGAGRFAFLEGDAASSATTLCGRRAVQVMPGRPGTIDLDAAARRLAPHGAFAAGPYLLRGRFAAEQGAAGDPIELTLFPDGRAILAGTDDADAARSLYARYVGA